MIVNKNVKKSIDSEVELTQLMVPAHANFSGKIHGGFILSLMDQIAFASASKYSGYYCVTASVNTVDFLNPVEIGELLTLKAAVNYVGNSSMVVGIRVESKNIQTGEIKHCNSSYFTMVAKDDDGNNMKVPTLEINTAQGVRRYIRSVKRLKNRHNRRKEFNENHFDYRKYLDRFSEFNNVILNIKL